MLGVRNDQRVSGSQGSIMYRCHPAEQHAQQGDYKTQSATDAKDSVTLFAFLGICLHNQNG